AVSVSAVRVTPVCFVSSVSSSPTGSPSAVIATLRLKRGSSASGSFVASWARTDTLKLPRTNKRSPVFFMMYPSLFRRLFTEQVSQFSGGQPLFAVLTDLDGIPAETDDHFLADRRVLRQTRHGLEEREMRVAVRLDGDQLLLFRVVG